MEQASTNEIQPVRFFRIEKKHFRFDKRLFFAILCLFLFFNSYILNEIIITADVYFRTYAEQVAVERIEELIKFVNKWQIVGYAIIPLILTVKISFTAVCLNIGTIFSNYKISFAKLFRIALIAELIFAIATLTRNMWLINFVDVNTMQDIQQFYPLSLIAFFNVSELPSWIIYPIQTLNLFELLYWFALATGLSLVLNEKRTKMFALVLSSYGVGLLVWMVFVVFLSINIS